MPTPTTEQKKLESETRILQSKFKDLHKFAGNLMQECQTLRKGANAAGAVQETCRMLCSYLDYISKRVDSSVEWAKNDKVN